MPGLFAERDILISHAVKHVNPSPLVAVRRFCSFGANHHSQKDAEVLLAPSRLEEHTSDAGRSHAGNNNPVL